MPNKKNPPSPTYRILLQESISASATNWFGGITFHLQENGETLLEGNFPDQAALRGFLNQLWDLNFTILRLERIPEKITI
jgi:hypothetical protein